MPCPIEPQLAQLSASHGNLDLAVNTLDELAITECDLGLIRELLRVEVGEHLRMVAAINATHSKYWFSGFRLSATERCVLWLLVTGVWCPTMRKALRHLQIEDAGAPTVAAVRSIVYSTGTDVEPELSPTTMLRRLGLVQAPKLDGTALRLGNGVLETIQEDARRNLALTGCSVRCLPEEHKAFRKAFGAPDIRRLPTCHTGDE